MYTSMCIHFSAICPSLHSRQVFQLSDRHNTLQLSRPSAKLVQVLTARQTDTHTHTIHTHTYTFAFRSCPNFAAAIAEFNALTSKSHSDTFFKPTFLLKLSQTLDVIYLKCNCCLRPLHSIPHWQLQHRRGLWQGSNTCHRTIQSNRSSNNGLAKAHDAYECTKRTDRSVLALMF